MIPIKPHFIALKLNKTVSCFMDRKWILFILLTLLLKELTFSQSSVISNVSIEEKGVVVSEIDKNYEEYISLLERHQLHQKVLIDSLNYFKKIRNKKYVFSGKDIKTINKYFSSRIELLNQSLLFPKIDKNRNEDFLFNNLIATHLKIKSLETYLAQHKIVGKNAKVLNLINEKNKLYRKEKKSLKKVKRIIISNKFRKSILSTWNISKEVEVSYLNNKIYKNIFDSIISSSYYQNYLSNDKNIKKSKKYFRQLINEKSSFNADVNFNNFINNIAAGLSNFVSNFLGVFSFRKGKLNENELFINNSLSLLQPLDVILEKTPFRLTDKFIPGYWGHAAIYVGNEAQLKALGIWDNYFVKKYHQEIREKHVIIEALRSRVAFNTFRDITNIDDYAHLRLVDEPTLAKKREMIIRVFAQIGKKYDFGYDVESSKKIICSELHYITFDEVTFNTDRIMGVNTISVDQVAQQGLKGGAFYPIVLYLDGIRIEKDKIFEIYDLLPTARNKEIRKLKKRLQ